VGCGFLSPLAVEPIFQDFYPLHKTHQGIAQHVGELAVLQVRTARRYLFALSANHFSGDSHHHRLGRYGLHHHGVGADAAALADGNVPQDLGSGTHNDPILEGGVTFTLSQAGASQGHPVVEGDIVSDLGGLSDYYAHPVIDEEAPTDAGTRVDLDAGKGSIQVGKPPSQELQLPSP
jgi:hypothetical protein